MSGEAVPWWRSAVVYQIYPRSFADASGDGVGDLEGIRRKLDHLAWLGVDAIWLSPIYPSPMADFGYDVSDHCDVDPVFGDLSTFDRLLAEAHDLGLRVLLDWVPNHTSDQHPWFLDARSSPAADRRDWYVWRPGREGGPPNNWRAAFGGPAWTYDEPSGEWYLHLFLPEQPDLNWANPEVREAMHSVLRFWLDRGVDGFRADVVHLIGKDEELPDQPPHLADLDLVGVHDHPRTHELLRGIRGVLDEYPGAPAMVGEVNLGSAELLAPYYGRDDQLHLVFDFSLLRAGWEPERWATLIAASERALAEPGAWPAWVLSNHDTSRHRTRYGGSEQRARVAAMVLLSLRGTPFLFAGEELGLEDAVITEADRVDPGGRDAERAPVPWDAAPGHGWPSPPWLPFPPAAERRNAATLRDDPDSILQLYHRLLRHRRVTAALHAGSQRLLDAPAGVLAIERAHEGDVRRLIANFTTSEVAQDVDEVGWFVDVATERRSEGDSWDGRLAAESAVLLSRRQVDAD